MLPKVFIIRYRLIKVKMWLDSIGLSSLNQANREDCKNIYLYKNINVEYTSLNNKIHIDLPEGYVVYINGVYKGKTPLNINNIPLGITTIRIESNEEYSEQKFNVENISNDYYEYIPILSKFSGSLFINTNPGNAKLFIDDVDVGITPYKIDNIVIGKHKIKLVLDGYMPLEKEIEMSRDESKKITEKLTKGVKVTFKDKLPEDVQIKMIKNDKVNIFKFNEPILLYPDKYEMEILSRKIDQQKINLDLSNGKDVELDLKLNLFKSKLILNNLKKESIVIIDNIDITDKIKNNSYELEIGDHQVKITTKDFKEITKKINIEKDKNFIMNLIYIASNVESDSFYTARDVLLGIGIPVIITGNILTIIGVAGFCIMEFIVFPASSDYFYSYSFLINERNAFIAVMGTGIGLSTISLIMLIISIPMHYFARKLEDGNLSLLLDSDKSGGVVIGLKLRL